MEEEGVSDTDEGPVVASQVSKVRFSKREREREKREREVGDCTDLVQFVNPLIVYQLLLLQKFPLPLPPLLSNRHY